MKRSLFVFLSLILVGLLLHSPAQAESKKVKAKPKAESTAAAVPSTVPSTGPSSGTPVATPEVEKTAEPKATSGTDEVKAEATKEEPTEASTDKKAAAEATGTPRKKLTIDPEDRSPVEKSSENSKTELGEQTSKEEESEEASEASEEEAVTEEPVDTATATPTESASPTPSASATPTPTKAPETMKFGLILPLTGPAAVWGRSMANAARLAFEDLEPEVQKKMSLVFEDDQMRGTVANSAFRKLSETDHVKGIVVFGAQSVTALAPLAEKAELPMFAITANKDTVEGKLYSFRHWLDASEQIKTMVPFMKEHDVRTISVVVVNHEAMQDYISKFAVAAAQENIEIVSKDEIPAGQETDFKDIVPKIKDTAPDSVLVALLPPQIAIFAKKMRDNGADIPMFGFSSIETMNEVKAAAGAMDGIIYTAPKLNKEFIKRFQDRFDAFPEVATANVYDMVRIWGQAVKSGATDTRTVAAAIRKLRDFQGVMGTYSITENNDFSLKADLKKVKRGSFRKIDEQ